MVSWTKLVSYSSSESFPLRNLTLGVLLVTGGTLAALPFRRYEAIPDVANGSANATGPILSELDTQAPSPATGLPSTGLPSLAQAVPASTGIPGAIPGFDSGDFASRSYRTQGEPADWHSTGRPAAHSPLPLTFDDLMTPIDQPEPIAQRFGATAANHARHLQQERAAAIEMPPMESLVMPVQPEGGERFESAGFPSTEVPALAGNSVAGNSVAGNLPTGKSPTGKSLASGSLASVPQPPVAQQRLPKSTVPASERLWIRQP